MRIFYCITIFLVASSVFSTTRGENLNLLVDKFLLSEFRKNTHKPFLEAVNTYNKNARKNKLPQIKAFGPRFEIKIKQTFLNIELRDVLNGFVSIGIEKKKYFFNNFSPAEKKHYIRSLLKREISFNVLSLLIDQAFAESIVDKDFENLIFRVLVMLEEEFEPLSWRYNPALPMSTGLYEGTIDTTEDAWTDEVFRRNFEKVMSRVKEMSKNCSTGADNPEEAFALTMSSVLNYDELKRILGSTEICKLHYENKEKIKEDGGVADLFKIEPILVFDEYYDEEDICGEYLEKKLDCSYFAIPDEYIEVRWKVYDEYMRTNYTGSVSDYMTTRLSREEFIEGFKKKKTAKEKMCVEINRRGDLYNGRIGEGLIHEGANFMNKYEVNSFKAFRNQIPIFNCEEAVKTIYKDDIKVEREKVLSEGPRASSAINEELRARVEEAIKRPMTLQEILRYSQSNFQEIVTDIVREKEAADIPKKQDKTEESFVRKLCRPMNALRSCLTRDERSFFGSEVYDKLRYLREREIYESQMPKVEEVFRKSIEK